MSRSHHGLSAESNQQMNGRSNRRSGRASQGRAQPSHRSDATRSSQGSDRSRSNGFSPGAVHDLRTTALGFSEQGGWAPVQRPQYPQELDWACLGYAGPQDLPPVEENGGDPYPNWWMENTISADGSFQPRPEPLLLPPQQQPEQQQQRMQSPYQYVPVTRRSAGDRTDELDRLAHHEGAVAMPHENQSAPWDGVESLVAPRSNGGSQRR